MNTSQATAISSDPWQHTDSELRAAQKHLIKCGFMGLANRCGDTISFRNQAEKEARTIAYLRRKA